MAKKYKDKKNQKLESTLTNPELKIVKDVEDYIDDEIDIQWENGFVLIDECIVNFECDPITKNPTGIDEFKRLIMSSILFSRYQDAGRNNNFAVNGQRRFTPISTI